MPVWQCKILRHSNHAPPHWVMMFTIVTLLCVMSPGAPLLAQGLDSDEAIDTIVGSDVKTEQTRAKANAERIVAAISNTRENAERVRKTFNLNEIDIVFVPDIDEEKTPIDDALTDYENEISVLRESIEGSALFYHAVNSRSIMLRDIIAMEYGEDNKVTIFIKGYSDGSY